MYQDLLENEQLFLCRIKLSNVWDALCAVSSNGEDALKYPFAVIRALQESLQDLVREICTETGINSANVLVNSGFTVYVLFPSAQTSLLVIKQICEKNDLLIKEKFGLGTWIQITETEINSMEYQKSPSVYLRDKIDYLIAEARRESARRYNSKQIAELNRAVYQGKPTEIPASEEVDREAWIFPRDRAMKEGKTLLIVEIDSFWERYFNFFNTWDSGAGQLLESIHMKTEYNMIFFNRPLLNWRKNRKKEQMHSKAAEAPEIVFCNFSTAIYSGTFESLFLLGMDLNHLLHNESELDFSISAALFGIGKTHSPTNGEELFVLRKCRDLLELARNRGNTIALSEPGYTFEWDVCFDQILRDKFAVLQKYLGKKGKSTSFYTDCLSKLFGSHGGKVNLALLADFLAKSEYGLNNDLEKKEFTSFSKKIYSWVRDPEERRQMRAAVAMYREML